ncbi:MAG: Lrp/AsnC family transcriptional regulator [Magnetococcales bacterium]|nr:Lrp/AsnC family transcriptional regulator [Magnetococcales bacterium]
MLTEPDRTLINQWQSDFPLCERPFDQVAAMMSASLNRPVEAAKIIERIGWLLQQGYLSRFAPMYHVERLGGTVTLVATRVATERFEAVVQQINSFPEVSQNYARDHHFNLWFVVATETIARQTEVLAAIEAATGCELLNLPKLAEFRIGFQLYLTEQGIDTVACPSQTTVTDGMVDPGEREIITATQQGLPLVERPYHALADRLDKPVSAVIGTLQRLLNCGIIRRIGLVPNHYRLGLVANAMTVWDVADEKIAQLGQQVGDLGFVTHCYHRPRHPPHWPYNLFAMVHGPDRETVAGRVHHIRQQLLPHLDGADVLYSQRILKKTGFRLAL